MSEESWTNRLFAEHEKRTVRQCNDCEKCPECHVFHIEDARFENICDWCHEDWCENCQWTGMNKEGDECSDPHCIVFNHQKLKIRLSESYA